MNNAPAMGSRQTGQAAGGKKVPSGQPQVWLLVPVEASANDSGIRNGCWARIWTRENFTGDALTITGPNNIPDLDQTRLFGLDWDDRVRSVELGAKASMTVFDNENYRDLVTQFKPGQRVPDVSKRTCFFEELASLKIDCQRP